MSSEIVEALGRLTEISFQFGPFLFALLVLLFVTKRAHRYYSDIVQRKDPEPQQQELNAGRFVYYASWAAAFVLIAVSVFWWFWTNLPRRRDFVQFKIVRLERENEHLTPRCDDLYVRTVVIPGMVDDEGNQRFSIDHYFVVPVTDHVGPDQVIWVDYFNEKDEVWGVFQMSVTDVSGKAYRVIVDRNGARLEELS